MFTRVLVAVLLCLGILCLAQAQIPQTGAGLGGGSAFTPSCTPSANFLARATTITSNSDKTNYDTLICGLETDSVGCVTGSEMVGLYVLAAPNATASLLNLCSSSFSLVSHGTITFTANQGYAGDGSTGYLDSQITASTSGLGLNSVAISVYAWVSRTTPNTSILIGANDVGANLFMRGNDTGNIADYQVNSSTLNSASSSDVKGLWVVTRTGASANAMYKNSNLTPVVSGTDASVGPAAQNIFISAIDAGGSPGFFTSDPISFAFIGAGLTAANAKKASDRINHFATTLLINAY